MQNNYDEIDVASDTTLIIGKNNAGKTTIITALDNLINHNNALGANDFKLYIFFYKCDQAILRFLLLHR